MLLLATNGELNFRMAKKVEKEKKLKIFVIEYLACNVRIKK
jgi:hypothetical protein